ncbi:helix-turn-helix domain-containing protein [Candidatus Peregrinibacteria bacterium]|nr:helix-turn-helix domain-containing protein [Candidatus Peregrinibacteria bacterium]
MIDTEENLFGRKEAANFLEISTRTLDRHVKSGRMNPVRKNGMLFFHKSDLLHLKSTDEIQNPHIVSIASHSQHTASDASSINKYKILWEATKENLAEKEKLLLTLHHQVGYLESELKNSVPLLESKNSQMEVEQTVTFLKNKLHQTRIGKALFMVLFFLSLTACFIILLTLQRGS